MCMTQIVRAGGLHLGFPSFLLVLCVTQTQAARVVQHAMMMETDTDADSTVMYTNSKAVAQLATGADAETNSSSESEGILLPNCPRHIYQVKTAAQDSFAWCNPNLVPAKERAPEKLQGLFWLKGLPLPDVMACFSTGRWDEDSLTLKVQVYQNFMWKDSYASLTAVSGAFKSGMTYYVTFESKLLDKAEISSHGEGLGSVPVFFFNSVSHFPFLEKEGTNGLKWSRPSYFGVWPLRVQTSEYEAWKVMDGAGEVISDNHAAMLEALQEEGTSTLIRFPETCSEEVQESSTVSPGSATCAGGLFVTLAEQVQLAIAHVKMIDGPFATFKTRRGCVVSYKANCQRGYVSVTPDVSCPEHKRLLKLPRSSPEGTFKDYWQVCSDEAGVLTTPHALIDQTWSTDVPAETPVTGCVRIFAADDWPELNALRGAFPEQRAGLIARRQAVGGCPLYRSDADRLARGWDFKDMGIWLNVIQRFQKKRAEGWAEGKNPKYTLANYVVLAFMNLGPGGNRTTSFTTFAELNCGEPSPFAGGPQVFRHALVAGVAADPHQARVFSTSTVPQSESCFQRTIPLFKSSGTPEHMQFRQMMDEAGFVTMHETVFPDVTAPIPDKGTGEAAPSEMDVGRSVLERVMMAVWGEQPSEETVDKVLPYLGIGKLCIFGHAAKDMLLLRSSQVKQIAEIRQTNAKFGMAAPRVQKAMDLLESDRYPAVKAMYKESAYEKGKEIKEVLATDLGDAVLFAGLLGTSDMTTKCIQFQWQDHKHVALYRKDKLAYLHELMRFDGAVTSFTTATKKEEEIWKLEGLNVSLHKDMPVQMSIASANRDESVFPNPAAFDPERANIGEQVSWNGRLKDVMARNYTAAPRFCPGYQTSIKIAMQVCDHYTQHLSQYSAEVGSYVRGTVEILKPGDWQGHRAVVSYTDFKTQKLCVLKPEEHPALYIGCYKASELMVIDPRPVFPRTVEDEAAKCPRITDLVAQVFARSAFTMSDQDSWVQKIKEKIVGKSPASHHISDKWADDYSTGLYTLIVHFQLRKYVTRHSDLVKIPERTGAAESFRIGGVVAPNMDIDDFDPNTFVGQLTEALVPTENCLQNMLRELPFDDQLDDPEENTWAVAMLEKHKRKKDWLMDFYKMYDAADGSPVWPLPEVNLAQLFLRGDIWEDRLEMSLAFDLIGAHRVELTQRQHGGETLPFVVKHNQFSTLTVRDGFGIYQGDMYFTSEGMPAIIELADGTVVQTGDKDWQYWKFVWRSCLITSITLLDHLHTTHFKAANNLAQATRAVLSRDHPLRRLMSIFTYGTIRVNLAAMHALAGPDHALARSSPFKNFASLSDIVPTMLPDVVVQHRPLFDDEAYMALPVRLQEAPYYKDGRLLAHAMRRMLGSFLELYKDEICTPKDIDRKSEIHQFRDYLANLVDVAHTKGTTDADIGCEDLNKRLLAGLWTVTGFHRHVGTVADYYVDPDLATFAWKEGEAFPRPRQTLILSVIAAFTANTQPKLSQDYLHVFKGIHREEEAMAIWERFHKELTEVHEQIGMNNVDRPVKNYHADPDIVECSVAV